MKTLILLSAIISVNCFADVYISSPSPQEALKLSGTIIGGFTRAAGTYISGDVSIPNPIMIDLLDSKTKKKVSTLFVNGDDMADGRLIAQARGRKFEFCAIGKSSPLYQEVVGCFGVDVVR